MRALLALILVALLLFCPAVPAAAQAGSATRADFVLALWTAFGAVPYEDTARFCDVSHNKPYTAAICWAADLGLVRGTGDDRFTPERPITREEAATILRRTADDMGRDTAIPLGLATCNDRDGISPWADDALYWATDCGVILWSPGGLLDPQGGLSEEDVSAIFLRFLSV